MFQSHIAIYLTILFSTIFGCGCNNFFNQELDIDSSKGKSKPIIVLLHGLGSDASCFNRLKEELKKHFPKADVVVPTKVQGQLTYLLSIKEQANLSLQALAPLKGGGSDLKYRPIILLGHSQGGLRAYKIYDLYKDVLNIQAIITVATPWEGAPIINTARKLLSEPSEWSKIFNRPVMQDMRELSKECKQHSTWLQEMIRLYLNGIRAGFSTPGIKDLTPKSPFLKSVKNTLPNKTIPILAIGGAQSDFSVFLSKDSKGKFNTLNKAWTKAVVGKVGDSKEHDMVVPLYSQLALNIVPKGSQNFQRVVISDALHDDILELPSHNKSKSILEHPIMFKVLQDFAEKVLCGGQSNRNKRQKAAQAA